MGCSSAVERLTVNQVVAGSIPAVPATGCSAAVARLLWEQDVGGSIPLTPTGYFAPELIIRNAGDRQ